MKIGRSIAAGVFLADEEDLPATEEGFLRVAAGLASAPRRGSRRMFHGASRGPHHGRRFSKRRTHKRRPGRQQGRHDRDE